MDQRPLNVRVKSIKLFEENRVKTFHDTGCDNDFQNVTPKAHAGK